MTNKDLKRVFKEINEHLHGMDKQHLKRLLNILIDIQPKFKATNFINMNLEKLIKKLISECMNVPNLNRILPKWQMKNIYTILGDYNYYPICPLCGRFIRINSHMAKHEKQSNDMSFTWDHIMPKSLGGANDLSNMQPAHKICNKHKGNKLLYHVNYTINIKMTFVENETVQNKKKKNKNLRKQDFWCHKQCSQHHR